MLRTHTTLPLLLAVITFTASASAQETDAAADLAAAYAQACDEYSAVCLNDLDATVATSFTAKSTDTSAALTSSFMNTVVTPLARRQLAGDVVEYYVDVQVGPGPHDHIGLHRVVREYAPYLPRLTSKSVMLVHGDIWDFSAAFLANGGNSASASVAVYLAQQNIDVWGVDLGWTMIPAETTDLSFMSNWGFSRDTHDIGIALGIARTTRLLTGQGYEKMNLLGWSRGGQLGYAYLDGESQIPSLARHVSGFIPVDIYLKTNNEQQRLDACSRLAAANTLMQSGVYANDTGKTLGPLGTLALVAPTATTPVPAFQPLTNEGVANLIGGATFLVASPPPVPSYHMAGGVWSQGGQVTNLAYQAPTTWYDLFSKAKAYQPWRQIADGEISVCNDNSLGTVSFDDHLSSITVPVLYVGAGGGFGADGLYTTTLLGSTDVTSHLVELYPTASRLLDVGHTDIFQGTNAQSQFWVTIKNWIVAH